MLQRGMINDAYRREYYPSTYPYFVHGGGEFQLLSLDFEPLIQFSEESPLCVPLPIAFRSVLMSLSPKRFRCHFLRNGCVDSQSFTTGVATAILLTLRLF